MVRQSGEPKTTGSSKDTKAAGQGSGYGVMVEHIWEGVYSNFRDVPAYGEGFEGQIWADRSMATITKILDEAAKQDFIPHVVAYRRSLLPLLAAIVGEKTREVTILDFGGGLGVDYVYVVHALPDRPLIRWHVVENQKICEEGKRVFQDDDRIQFHTGLPHELHEVTIVHANSSIHYVDDWKTMLGCLARYRPLYFLFTDLTAGDIPTYATSQNYYGSKIPCWFFNVDDVIGAMLSYGYRLSFKSRFLASILGREQQLPQENFPPEYRLAHTCSLLFGRID